MSRNDESGHYILSCINPVIPMYQTLAEDDLLTCHPMLNMEEYIKFSSKVSHLQPITHSTGENTQNPSFNHHNTPTTNVPFPVPVMAIPVTVISTLLATSKTNYIEAYSLHPIVAIIDGNYGAIDLFLPW